MNLPFAIVVLAVTLSRCSSAELELDKRVVSEAFARLSNEKVLELQSNLTNELYLQGQNVSTACVKEIQKLRSTEWEQAITMLDAIGKPGSGLFEGNYLWLGSFSECAKMEKFKYCLAGFELKVHSIWKDADQMGALGTCMPQECNQDDIRLLLNKLPLSLNYAPLVKVEFTFPRQSALSAYGNTIMCEDRTRSYSHGTLAMFVICGIILALCLFGTILELFLNWLESPSSCINQTMQMTVSKHVYTETLNSAPSKDETNSMESQNRICDDLETLIPSLQTRPSFKDNFIAKFFICFSLVKNTKAVMNTGSPDRAILSINGIRTISMMWVILGHCYAIGETNPGLENPLDLYKVLQRFTFLAVENAFFSVDSFFLLSGLLVSYLGLKRLETKGKLPLWKFYLHRYIRLTPTYGFIILFLMYLLPLVGKGPIWSTISVNILPKNCENYWWTNLLYINNFHPTKLGKECIGWGWYLANDMQFYIISPIILYAMYKFRILGAIVCNGFLIAVSAIVTGSLMYHYKLKAFEVVADVNSRPKNGASFEDIIYTKPYCRIQPYLVGMILGYLLFKKISFRGRLKWLFYLIGWAVAIVLGLTVVYGTWGSSKPGGHPFNMAENITYASFSRLTWALAVSWVIFACQNGFGGLVQSFLSWRGFMPLSRLTYGAYLIHSMTLLIFYQSKLSTRAYTDLDFAFRFVSITVMSYAAAFILAITVEYPILNIDKLLFS